MNYIDIAFVAVTVIMIAVGARRGFVASALATLKYLLGIPLSYYVSGKLYRPLYDSYVRDYICDKLTDKINTSDSYEELLSGINGFIGSIPKDITDNFDLSLLYSTEPQQLGAVITDSIIEPVALAVLRIVIFIIVFILFGIIISLIVSAFSKMQKKKHAPLKHTNRFFGGVFGLLKAALLVFTAAAAIEYIEPLLPQGNSLSAQADASVLLEFINKYNPLYF